jgi:hypothetical protein
VSRIVKAGFFSLKETITLKIQKIVILLALSIGLYFFTTDFSAVPTLEFNSIWHILYVGYFNDLVQPFGLYFALCLFENWIPVLKPWWVKVLLVFLGPAVMEIGQYLYTKLPSPGTYVGVFDPLDLVMYAAGGLLAALVERQVFARVFKFWE